MLYGFKDPTEESDEPATDQAVDLVAAPREPRPRWLFAILGLIAGVVLTAVAWALWPANTAAVTQVEVDAAITDALSSQADESTAATVYSQIAASLVVVRAQGPDSDQAPHIGGGVVINEQGQILTANHVVAEATSIELLFSDGTSAVGEVFTERPDLDIAVLTAQGGGARVPAVMGNSRTLQVGDPVYAVGNPLGLTGSLSSGVISGLNRSIPFPDEDELVLQHLIQFDAAVNQGSSGGPLLNADGQVVGIVTALADPAGQGFFVGIGFAVPIDIAASGAANGPAQ